MGSGRRVLVLLVGPKGSGKSRIAAMLGTTFGAHVVPVEAMWLERTSRSPRPAEAERARAWEAEGFDAVAERALRALDEEPLVVLDTTGASEHTQAFVAKLAASGALMIVRVRASLERCGARIASRDARTHLPVDPARLPELHALSEGVALPFVATFDNDGAWDELAARAFFHDALELGERPVRAIVTRLETERLTLRDWEDADLAPFAALNADPRVMEHFPAALSREESDALAARIRRDLGRRGVGLWAVEERATRAFVGFTGLAVPSFEAPFLPAVEIGWRLAVPAWGRGLASEAARAAVAQGFAIGLPEIVSFTATTNLRSIRVMERIGMRRDRANDFEHPRVPVGHRLRPHVLYRLAPGGTR